VTRRLVNLLTALSLLACVAVAVLWARGRTCADRVYLSFSRGDVYAFLNYGEVLVDVDDIPGAWGAPEWAVFDARTSAMSADDLEVIIGGREDYALNRFGFALGRFDSRNHVTHTVAAVPDWFLLLLFSALPLGRAWRYLARRRRAAGQCAACGYDLTGNVTGVCPECGTPASAPPAPA
jgi:hypothetical protein